LILVSGATSAIRPSFPQHSSMALMPAGLQLRGLLSLGFHVVAASSQQAFASPAPERLQASPASSGVASMISGAMPCDRPARWCSHARAQYHDNFDCDGDGINDPYCVNDDGSAFGFLGSAQDCKDSWPRGRCEGAPSPGPDARVWMLVLGYVSGFAFFCTCCGACAANDSVEKERGQEGKDELWRRAICMCIMLIFAFWGVLYPLARPGTEQEALKSVAGMGDLGGILLGVFFCCGCVKPHLDKKAKERAQRLLLEADQQEGEQEQQRQRALEAPAPVTMSPEQVHVVQGVVVHIAQPGYMSSVPATMPATSVHVPAEWTRFSNSTSALPAVPMMAPTAPPQPQALDHA